MNIPVYNCLIDENTEDQSGIYTISFVDAPANEVDFITLAKQPKLERLNRDSKKQVLTGVVLRPDQLIYRNDSRGEYYIRFSADQIEKIAQKMMRTGIALHNTTHQHQNPLDGNFLTELWIVENPQSDKSQALGFTDLPKGTLMCSYKIADKNYWDTQVMTGNVKGFSLEGFFFQEISKNNTTKLITNLNQNEKMSHRNKKSGTLLSRISQFFLDIQAIEKADATKSGVAYVIFTLADGKEVHIDVDGFATLNEEQLPAGEHPLADGNILIVDEQGQFVETKEAATKNTDPAQATAPEALRRAKRQMMGDETDQAAKESAPKDQNSTEVLKQKIADLEAKLAELANLAKEANAEVQNLRRHTPSIMPATAMAACRKQSEMKRYEQMAQALTFTIRSRK